MEMDRGALARIDLRIPSGLDHNEHSQLVRVSVSEAVSSTWRRYCRALGVAMGRRAAGHIAHELGAVEGSTTVYAEHLSNYPLIPDSQPSELPSRPGRLQ